MAYAKFKAHKFSLLNITNVGSEYVLKGSECGLACVNIPSCFSFNLAAFGDIINGKILCELLPSDIYNNSKKLVASQFHHHYSIEVSWNWLENWNISLTCKTISLKELMPANLLRAKSIKLHFVLFPEILKVLRKYVSL